MKKSFNQSILFEKDKSLANTHSNTLNNFTFLLTFTSNYMLKIW